jgi:hypothetical protein
VVKFVAESVIFLCAVHLGFIMGRICVPDKLDSTSCADSNGHRTILASYLCSLQYVILCGYCTVNADQFCRISACPEL